MDKKSIREIMTGKDKRAKEKLVKEQGHRLPEGQEAPQNKSVNPLQTK